MEGYAVHAYSNDIGRNTHARHEVGHVKEMQVQLLGIIQGELPVAVLDLSLIHISEPTRLHKVSRMPSSA